jgi:hypothetical protein
MSWLEVQPIKQIQLEDKHVLCALARAAADAAAAHTRAARAVAHGRCCCPGLPRQLWQDAVYLVSPCQNLVSLLLQPNHDAGPLQENRLQQILQITGSSMQILNVGDFMMEKVHFVQLRYGSMEHYANMKLYLHFRVANKPTSLIHLTC